jgi:APA family basic amino acid/polyamine antiporter
MPPEAVPARAPASSQQQPTLLRRLTLLDSLMLLVGGIVGSAIFLTARDTAGSLPTPALFLGVWVVGGAVSLIACFAFAELGAMFPEAGGQYVYFREAFGSLAAFLYGWMYFAVVGPATSAALSVASAKYLGVLLPQVSDQHVIFSLGSRAFTRTQFVALAVIALLTWINVIGVKRAAILQNVATWLKYAAMAGFVLLGFAIGHGSWSHFHAGATRVALPFGQSMLSAFGVALIGVFFAYDGWVYIGQAAGEVEHPERNLPRALIGGIALVMLIYVAVNAAYLYALPVPAIAQGSETTAADAAAKLFLPAAGLWISGLVALSCFGALSCNILSSARVTYALSADGQFFRWMGAVHPRWRTPARVLIVQALWSGVLALSGRYDQLFTFLMFLQVLSYALAVIGLFVLRRTRPDTPRPYRCPGYPWLPASYVLIAIAWSANTVWTRPVESLIGVAILALGLPGYFYWRSTRNQTVGRSEP